MVSFDVVSLFTKVPIVNLLELLSHHFEYVVLALFKHALTSTYFRFDGQFYEQMEGVAMSSPIFPVIANLFREDFEKKAAEQATHKTVCCFRYVDDTFVIWPRGQMARKTDKTSEPPQWTPKQDTVYNGKRRPPPILGHGHLQKNGWLPRAQSISETHPYRSLSTQEFPSPTC